MKRKWLRIIDVNLNRCREGLRVCEEIVRFVLEDSDLTFELKGLRHKVQAAVKRLPGGLEALLHNRESQKDVGKDILIRLRRKNYKDIYWANMQRVKESLRVLEEFSDIFDHSLSKYFAHLRFKIYALEKKSFSRLR